MKRMLINATQADELRVAIIDDSVLFDLDIEYPGQESKKANIYKGKISSIEPSLGAVFVDYGSERHGFLPLKEISREYFMNQDRPFDKQDIKKLLRIGQEVVVQVEKEERGSKGAALTTFISLAGSYIVLMPNNPRAGGISRRINVEDRDELRDIINQLPLPEGMGIIVRTAGVGKSKEELEWDLQVLLRYWQAIKQAAVMKPAPYLIHQEGDAIIRSTRDNLRQDISEIIVDQPKAYEHTVNYIRQIRPDFIDRVKLYSHEQPLFSHFQIEQQIESAYQRELRLPSGGSIVIDHTEALVSIDINSARATKGSSIEETALNTNLEAAQEIARQLRIRDIGGLVVIDFIDMMQQNNQRAVENRLREALRHDRARIQTGRISRFGLLEMSRQRIRTSLIKTTRIPCTHCEGQGMIRSVESVALSVIHLIEEHASRHKNIGLQVQVPTDISAYLMNEKRDTLQEMQDKYKVEVVIIPNPHFLSPHFHIKQVEEGSNVASYSLIKVPRAHHSKPKPASALKSNEEPAINDFLSSSAPAKPPARKARNDNGLVKRIWKMIFGAEEAPKKKTPAKKQTHKKSTSSRRKQQNRKQTGQRDRRTQSSRSDNGNNRRRNNNGNNNQRNRRGSRGGQQRSSAPRREKPATTETPKAVDKAPAMQKPQPIEKPITVEKPVVVEKPPVAEKKPPVAEKPVVTEKPAVTGTAADKYTNPNYQGIGGSDSQPLQQVTTKKSEQQD